MNYGYSMCVKLYKGLVKPEEFIDEEKMAKVVLPRENRVQLEENTMLYGLYWYWMVHGNEEEDKKAIKRLLEIAYPGAFGYSKGLSIAKKVGFVSLFYFDIKSFITADPSINPATEGTKETEPGVLFSSLLAASISIGFSGDQTTFSLFIPLFFSSLLITLERGSVCVENKSTTLKSVGSSLLPAPMDEMMGILSLWAMLTRAIFPETVSMASTM